MRTMGVPLSIRLADDIRETLEAETRARGVGLATFVRDLATRAARDVRRAAMRAESEQVSRYLTQSEPGRALYDEIGTPSSDAG